MANDKDLRELLELISSTRSMLENAKKKMIELIILY